MGKTAVVESAQGSEPDPPAGRLARLPILSWILFDFATTIFSYVVLTRYFREWIVIERGQPDIVIGVMSVTVAVALVVALPSLGALADRLGRHKPLLVAFTLSSVTGTALLGVVDGVVVALVVAGVVILCFNSAEAQYHPLLASVAPPRVPSLVSGIGVGVGYVGALVALILGGATTSAPFPTPPCTCSSPWRARHERAGGAGAPPAAAGVSRVRVCLSAEQKCGGSVIGSSAVGGWGAALARGTHALFDAYADDKHHAVRIGKLLDWLPIRRPPLYVEQYITADGSHKVYTAVGKKRFFCKMTPRHPEAAVRAFYRAADKLLRSSGVKDFVQIVTPLAETTEDLPALAIGRNGSVSLTPLGRGRGPC